MIFPYLPQIEMTETLDWLSDVIEARKGKEQRIRVRNAPRHRYECRYNSFGPRAKNLIAANQSGEYDIPLWHDASPAVVSPGATSISVDTRYADYQQEAILYADEMTNEVVTISGKTDNTLTVSAVVGNYPAGSYIIPSRRARMTDMVGVDDVLSTFNRPSKNWRAVENYVLPSIEMTQYKNYDVVEWPTVLTGGSVEREFLRPLEWLDFGTGVVRVDSRMDWSRTNTKSVRAFLEGKQDIWEFRRWLHGLAGQIVPFWLPTFAEDLQVVGNYAADATVLSVDRVDYTLVWEQPGFKHLAIFLPCGTTLYREVTGSAIVGTTENISIDAPLGIAGGAATKISYMPLVRLAADRIELFWHHGTLVETAFPVRGIDEKIAVAYFTSELFAISETEDITIFAPSVVSVSLTTPPVYTTDLSLDIAAPIVQSASFIEKQFYDYDLSLDIAAPTVQSVTWIEKQFYDYDLSLDIAAPTVQSASFIEKIQHNKQQALDIAAPTVVEAYFE